MRQVHDYTVMQTFLQNDYQCISMAVHATNSNEIALINEIEKDDLINDTTFDALTERMTNLSFYNSDGKYTLITIYNEGMPFPTYITNYQLEIEERCQLFDKISEKFCAYEGLSEDILALLIDENQITISSDTVLLNEIINLAKYDKNNSFHDGLKVILEKLFNGMIDQSELSLADYLSGDVYYRTESLKAVMATIKQLVDEMKNGVSVTEDDAEQLIEPYVPTSENTTVEVSATTEDNNTEDDKNDTAPFFDVPAFNPKNEPIEQNNDDFSAGSRIEPGEQATYSSAANNDATAADNPDKPSDADLDLAVDPAVASILFRRPVATNAQPIDTAEQDGDESEPIDQPETNQTIGPNGEQIVDLFISDEPVPYDNFAASDQEMIYKTFAGEQPSSENAAVSAQDMINDIIANEQSENDVLFPSEREFYDDTPPEVSPAADAIEADVTMTSAVTENDATETAATDVQQMASADDMTEDNEVYEAEPVAISYDDEQTMLDDLPQLDFLKGSPELDDDIVDEQPVMTEAVEQQSADYTTKKQPATTRLSYEQATETEPYESVKRQPKTRTQRRRRLVWLLVVLLIIILLKLMWPIEATNNSRQSGAINLTTDYCIVNCATAEHYL